MAQKKIMHVPLDSIKIKPCLRIRKRNNFTLSSLTGKLRSGIQLPPVILNEDNELVEGFHRYEAYRRVFCEDTMIPVQIMKFASDSEAILYSLQVNSSHGQPLTTFEARKTAFRLIRDYGLSEARIARAAGTSHETVLKWYREEVTTVRVLDPETQEEHEEPHPIKRGHSHLKDRVISWEQYEQMDSSHHGCSIKFHINKVLERITADMIEDDQEVYMALENLASEIHNLLDRVGFRTAA